MSALKCTTFLNLSLIPVHFCFLEYLSLSTFHTCTQEEADAWLDEELEEYEAYVDKAVKVKLEQNQYDALVSWTYNLGPANLNASTMLKLLNAGDYHTVPNQMKRWNKAGGEVKQGLVRRREAESTLWQGEDWSNI